MKSLLLTLVLLAGATLLLRADAVPPLSIAISLPQRQTAAPGFDGATDDAPRALRPNGDDSICPVILKNESDHPLRLPAADQGWMPQPLSFRLELDGGHSVTIRWHPSAILNSFSLHPVPRYWLLQPGESLVISVHLWRNVDEPIRGSWAWNPSPPSAHRGVLVPIYEVEASDADAASKLSLWTGHIEGKGVPVSLP